MGNKINQMAICSRKDSLKTHKIEDFSSFISLPENTSFENSTVRQSIFDNPENVSLNDFLVEKKTKTPAKKNKLFAMKVLRKEFIIEKGQ
jgi:hypothetical protein